MTYNECVVQAAIAIFSSRQIAAPQSAVDLALVIATTLKENGYLDDGSNSTTDTSSDDRVGA